MAIHDYKLTRVDRQTGETKVVSTVAASPDQAKANAEAFHTPSPRSRYEYREVTRVEK
jgi:hypothetical protein